MALSQIQCLDENHVNPRILESKPEFLYCEDQRLALEALLRDGRDAFYKFLELRGLRGFLSDPELEVFTGAAEPYDPGSELFPSNGEDNEPPLSLHYWPELSDTSVGQMDLGWPDTEAYRGVTRTTVYAQPPLDGQAHIKEIVRKMIAQAQKVIAVVMDMFTDVDIFRDLLDAGFKRKVAVYILLERTTLPHFLSMCRRANMHAGHLKNLRVRCTGGADFHSRSSTRVRGRMGHRFMFIDGDKAVSGSYSFTWISSRLERHLITVVTGQAVNTFDQLFRYLYTNSSSVDLRQIDVTAEPAPEPPPQPAPVALPAAALARKLYNPKYALLAAGNNSPSSTPSSANNSPKESNSQNPAVPETRKKQRRKASIEAVQEAPPLHPGLVNLEKACLISYLPTWPEPDPPSDVIGFINIRDANRPTQVHLQRSEMFEVSRAIKFSSPVSIPKETLPEVAIPRKITAAHEEMHKSQPARLMAENSVADRAQPAQRNAGPSDVSEAPKQEAHKSGAESEKERTVEENKIPDLKTSAKQAASHNTAPHLSTHTSQQVSNNASSVHNEETLPKSRPLTAEREDMHEFQPTQHKAKAEDSVADQAQPTQRNPGLSDIKHEQQGHRSGAESEPEKEITEDKMPDLNTLAKQDASHDTTAHLSAHISQQVNASRVHYEETLPEVTKFRQVTAKHEDMHEFQLTQAHLSSPQDKVEASGADQAQPMQLKTGPSHIPEQQVHISGAESESEKETTKEENKVPDLNTPANQEENHNTRAQFNTHTSQQFSSNTSSVHSESERNSHTTHTASMNMSEPEPLPVSNNAEQTEPSVDTHTDNVYRRHYLDLYSVQTSHLLGPSSTYVKSQLTTKEQTENMPQCTYLVTQSSPEGTTVHSIPTPTTHSNVSPSSASQTHSNTSSSSTTPYSNSSPSLPPFTSSSTSPHPLISTPPLPSSATSSSSSTAPPVPKPRTVQLVIKDSSTANDLDLPEISIISTRSPMSHCEPQTATTAPTRVLDAVLQVENELETVSEQQTYSRITAVVQNETENARNPGGGCFTPQQTLSGSSQETEGICEKSVAPQNDDESRAAVQIVTETKLQHQSDVLISDTPKIDSVDIQQVMPREAEPRALMMTENKITPKPELEDVVRVTEETEEARPIISWEASKMLNEENNNVTQRDMCLVTANEHQNFSFCEIKPQNRNSVEAVNSSEVATRSSEPSTHVQKHNPGPVSDILKDSADIMLTQQFYPSVASAHSADISQKTAEHNTHAAFQETQQNLEMLQSSQIHERSLSLHFPNPPTHTPEWHSLTPERESSLLTPLSTPDRFSPRTPTPDLRFHTPDFRTPTPDMSDGYISSREDSTTSDEYYECNDLPFHDPVFNQAAHHTWTTEDHVSSMHTNTATVSDTGNTTPTQSPLHINYSTAGATYSSSESSSDSETQSLSGSSVTFKAASSYSPEMKHKTREETETSNNEESRDEDGERTEESNRTEPASLSLSLETTNNEKIRDEDGERAEGSNKTESPSLPLSLESKKITNQLKDGKISPQLQLTLDKTNAAQNQTPKRKRALVLSLVDNFVPAGEQPGELNHEGSEPKRVSSHHLPPETEKGDKVSSGGERSVDETALRPSDVDRKDMTQSARDTEGQKSLHAPPKPSRGQQQQQDSDASSLSLPAQPSRSSHLLPGVQPPRGRAWGSLQRNQVESNAFPNSFKPLDNASSLHGLPSRPPPPFGKNQTEVSQNQQSFVTAVQSRTRAGLPQVQRAYPKPPGSFLHTRVQSQLSLHPQSVSSHNQTLMQTPPSAKQGSGAVVATGEAPGQEEGRTQFGFTFSRLYSLKGLKDRMSKLPSQGKKSSTRSPVQGPKSTG